MYLIEQCITKYSFGLNYAGLFFIYDRNCYENKDT